MKKFSKSPEIPKISYNAKYPRKKLNESMQLLFPRDTIKSNSKPHILKFLSKNNSISSNHSKSQTLATRHTHHKVLDPFENSSVLSQLLYH